MKAISKYIYGNFPEVTALFAALTAFILYLITADSSVSYWDCPEYVLTASTLQIGHPPGNPVWTLAMRMATIPFPPESHAVVINICSGILMAASVFFLARIIFFFAIRLIPKFRIRAAVAAAAGALCFAVLDSTWYSAVEAEVYAFSTFLTAFTIWLMLRRAREKREATRTRLLILIAYIIGLSLGVHQLNLLCLPVLALIFAFREYRSASHQALKAWITLFVSFILTGLVLAGLMPGVTQWAAGLERLFVNRFDLPYFSGVIAYPVILAISFILAVRLIPTVRREWVYLLFQTFLWISGIFLFNSHFFIALLLSIACSAFMVIIFRLSRKIILTVVWMIGMVWLGYSAIALILIRGYASPPVNEGSPVEIFSLQRYINREQYGSKPLLYGPTPFSRPILIEEWIPGKDSPVYSRYMLKKGSPRYFSVQHSARLNHRSGLLSHNDSLVNSSIIDKNHGYLLADYSFSRVTTPELDIWFPRITSGAPNMLASYEDWCGMTKENMQEVEISTVVDSCGNMTGKLTGEGEREKEKSLRPTYLQNFRYFATYQVFYMYFRYFLWNFAGRQNDLPSTGEIDHGNFITGFNAIDSLMTGDSSFMPPSASTENKGRHTYYALPLLFGIAGIVYLFRHGRRGRHIMAVVGILFLMTGLAIVVYLNQTPNEPRERDYSFLGSYMAYCIWIAFGFIASALTADRFFHSRRAGNITLAIVSLGLFLLLAIENFPDHDRSGRFHTREFTLSLLEGKERDIIFSYGDNYTFPLWYIQEVEKMAPGAAIVDLAYLATPEYVVNLLKQGEKGIHLTAGPEDIAYGAYLLTKISADADTVPVPLIDILRELYSVKEGNPVIRHSRATLPGLTRADTLTVNLHDFATASGIIPFRTLMILDIVATNLEQPQPRPVSFLTQIKRDLWLPFEKATRMEAFSQTYAPDMTNEEYLLRLEKSANAIEATWERHSEETPYIDPVIEDQVRRQRGAYVRAVQGFFESGDSVKGKKLLLKFPKLYPFVSPGSIGVADIVFNETLTASRLLLNLASSSEDTLALSAAKELLLRSRKEPLGWFEYYKSLPTDRRGAVSNKSRLLIKRIPEIERMLTEADSLSKTYKNVEPVSLPSEAESKK